MTESYNEIYGTANTLPLPEAPAPAEKPAETYARKEQITAFLAMLAGFLFIRLCLYHVTGLLTTLFFWGVFTFCIVYLRKSGKTFRKQHKALAAVLYLFSAVYTITANGFLKSLNTVFLLLAGSLFIYTVCHPEGNVFRFLPYSLQKAFLASPFANFGRCPAAAVSAVRGSTGGRNLLYVLGGLLIAVPVTVTVAALLCSADHNMNRMIESLLFEPDEELIVLIPHLAFGALAGFWLFSLLYSNVTGKNLPLFEQADCERSILGLRFLPNPMVYAAVTPICILYVMFFVSQFQYFLGGFTGELAENLTYAEYARKGFFELCWVCCINAAVIGVMSFCAKLCGVVKPMMLKVYTLFLSVSSLILAGTALAKMFLYIANYGMTQLRVYTTWFMLLLVILFVLVIIRQFRMNLHVCKIGFAAFTVMFGLLCFSRPDAWMTRYNAEMCLAGHLEELDTDMIYWHMSADAAAVLSTYQNGELAECRVGKNAPVDAVINKHLAKCAEDPYRNLNLSAWILQVNGVTEE